MQGRTSRGASYMVDPYDAQYDHHNHGEYDHQYDANNHLEGCTKYAKHTIFGVNFAMLLIGVALIVISFLKKPELNILGFDPIDDYMVYIIISFGVLIVITSFLGCSGATTQTKCIIIIYIILLIISFIVELLISTYIFTSSHKLNKYSKNQWNNLSVTEQISFQSENNCVGYDECSDIIQNNLQNNLKMINWICIIIAIYQIIMISVGCILCTKLSPSKSNPI